LELKAVPTAYLLVSHGSRDPRPQIAMNRLAQLVREHLNVYDSGCHDTRLKISKKVGSALAAPIPIQSHALTKGTSPAGRLQVKPGQSKFEHLNKFEHSSKLVSILERSQPAKLSAVTTNVASVLKEQAIVGTATLEGGALPLHQQIYEFGLRVKAAGITCLKIVPLFLMSGVHVIEDIPAEVMAAREWLGNALDITLCPHLGGHSKMSDLLRSKLGAAGSQGQLLIAHGSRRSKGNRAIESLTKSLGISVAYWAVEPNLETQVIHLMQQGCTRLRILPYFLFSGGITDAVIHRTEELAERFPKVDFHLLPPLGASPDLAEMVIELSKETFSITNIA
jgi:sirohydrochlorin cobaltochelatase